MITQQIHNPQNLTPQQVGVADGWRLLYVGEEKPHDCQLSGISTLSWFSASIGESVHRAYTYRTRTADPFASAWIKMSERKPTAGNANAAGEVWFWIPRFAHVGPRRDIFDYGNGATHWQPCRLVPEFTPAPPVVELTQAQKDEAAFKRDAIASNYASSGETSLVWRRAIAYARNEKATA